MTFTHVYYLYCTIDEANESEDTLFLITEPDSSSSS